MRFLLATQQSRRWGLAKIDNRSVTWGQGSALAHYFICEGDATNLRDKIPKLDQAFGKLSEQCDLSLLGSDPAPKIHACSNC